MIVMQCEQDTHSTIMQLNGWGWTSPVSLPQFEIQKAHWTYHYYKQWKFIIIIKYASD